jgi:hypothetical protein
MIYKNSHKFTKFFIYVLVMDIFLFGINCIENFEVSS